MQKENSSSDGVKSSTNTTTHLSRNPFLSPTSHEQFDPTDFTSFYPSLFPPNMNSFSISPSDGSFDDASNAIATENRLNQASFILEYQQLYNSYTLSLASLQESIKEVDALRQENDHLRCANVDLVQRLSLLSKAMIQNCILSSGQSSLSFVSDFNRLSIGGTVRDGHVAEDVSSISPTSVIENNRFERRNVEKISIPKSISVRSGGYLKMNQRAGGSSTRAPTRHRVTSQSLTGSQQMYVPGGKREEAAALELDVYNQGTSKTELCNKWHETGTCPYGNNCQFAHGISELRPVIRHPRYKTEVCRMVLAGEICPYGHRCHFRHTLTDEESLLAQR